MEYKKIIEQLESEFLNGKKSVFGKKIDVESCLTLIIRLKNEYPKAMSEADALNERRQSILDEARAEAERITGAARKQAETVVSDARAVAEGILTEARLTAEDLVEKSAVLRIAEDRAARMFESASNECNKLAMQSYNAVTGVFNNAESAIVKALKQLENARELLMAAFTDSNG